MTAPDLLLHTWPQVEDYLKRSTGIILAAGSVEQHGTAGLIGTDALCAEAVARQAAIEAGALLGPTIALGMAQFNLGFPGTITLRPTTLIAVTVDYLASLARAGFTHVYVVNGHGGNLAPIRSAFQEFHARRSFRAAPAAPFYARLTNWWEPPETAALRRRLYSEGEGFHATPSEIAITAALFPERVFPEKFGAAAPRPPESALIRHGGDPYFDAADHRARYPDGRVRSDPAGATAEQGRLLLATAAREIAADYRAFAAAR
jgi:creatinine amidohydrolase